MRGLRAFVSEPEGDHRKVHARLEHMRRRGMPLMPSSGLAAYLRQPSRHGRGGPSDGEGAARPSDVVDDAPVCPLIPSP
jgi:hypothetical protein